MSSLGWRTIQRYRLEGLSGVLATGLAFVSRVLDIRPILVHALVEYVIGVETRDELRAREESNEFGAEVTVEVEYSGRRSDIPARLETQLGEYTCGRPFVAECGTTLLFGDKAIPVDEDGITLEAFSSRQDPLEEHIFRHPTSVLPVLKHRFVRTVSTERTIRTACSFASVGSGYCEWIQSVLTRLQGLERYTEATGIRPTILLPRDPEPWMIESLEFFGYTDWIEWDGVPTRVENFVVPSVRTGEYAGSYYRAQLGHDDTIRVVHPLACRWLATTARQQIDIERLADESDIYISREKAETRTVVNRADLDGILDRHEIVPQVMESMPFDEQVKRFVAADLIVGPHGAGLVNSIFCNQASVLELFGTEMKSTYFILSNCTGNRYEPILCESTSAGMRADPDSIESALKDLDEGENGSVTANGQYRRGR